MIRIVNAVIVMLAIAQASLLAMDRSMYSALESEVKTLVGGPGDIWAYSGNGGYVFKFEKDVCGGPEK